MNPTCPNCGAGWNEKTCLNCGFQLGSGRDFWAHMGSCGGLMAVLTFAVGGICSVSGGYGVLQPHGHNDVGPMLFVVGGLPTIALVTTVAVGVWLGTRWPSQRATERIKLLVTGAGAKKPFWSGVSGVISLVTMALLWANAIDLFLPLDGYRIHYGVMALMTPVFVIVCLGELWLSLVGRK